MSDTSKDFSSVSPSAAFLVQLKAYTDIPFAKEVAALLKKEDMGMAQNISETGIKNFFRWLIHFENRYRTVQKILSEKAGKNILELSSGYSFRGLSMCLENEIHFIDTDLPELITGKQKMTGIISARLSSPLKGLLELLPLNVLDEQSFKNIIDRFENGPVCIVNEGLLMYLDTEEKTKLCRIIHDVLAQRGGQWITADVYKRRKNGEKDILDSSEEAKRFREQHHIEENKFEDFEQAESFFTGCGFRITRRLALATEDLSCLRLLSPDKRKEAVQKLKNAPHENETWCLEVV